MPLTSGGRGAGAIAEVNAMTFAKTLSVTVLASGFLASGIAAGCAPAYCDGYDCHGSAYYGYHHDSYRDPYRNNSYYYYHQREYGGRHWVCDSDGDDCHWSY